MTRTSLSRCRGFTIVEVAISAGVLAITLGTGTIIARAAMRSAATSVDQAEATSQTARVSRDLETVLVSAGRSTLQGIPVTGAVEEPLVDGVAYQSVSFRAATDFADGQVVYTPAPGATPYRIWFEQQALPWAGSGHKGESSGSLMYHDGVRDRVLVPDVAEASLLKEGDALTVRWIAPTATGELAAVEKTVILKAQ